MPIDCIPGILRPLLFILVAAAPASLVAEAPAQPDGMVLIPAGTYQLGSEAVGSMTNEGPVRSIELPAFWLDVTPVTNAQFAAFVEATGYLTTAERPVDWEELKKQLPPDTPKPPAEQLRPGAIVFTPPARRVDLRDLRNWWTWTPGACWRHPEGPGSDVAERLDHPVVQVSWDDAVAYAEWAGKRLPTEDEWEAAARGGLVGKRFNWGDEFLVDGTFMANVFTGDFPFRNTAIDGHAGVAPVRSFPPNGYGLYGMAGNVWNWTADRYAERAGTPPVPGDARRVIKGGSFLCHLAYCESYRPSARRGTPYDTGSGHVGFRCARDP